MRYFIYGVYFMRELKTGIYQTTFWMFAGKFLPLTLFPCTFSKPLKPGRLKRFRNTRKYMNRAE